MRESVCSLCSPFSAHSHTTIRFQPSFCQAASLRLSRFTFRDHFCIQNDTLLLGIEEEAQPCRCQKQPRTSMSVRARETTMSGRPTNRLSHTR